MGYERITVARFIARLHANTYRNRKAALLAIEKAAWTEDERQQALAVLAAWRESTYPICNGCGADIIVATPGQRPWTIVVRDPHGREGEAGVFCLGCMINLAKAGVDISDLDFPREG